MDQVWKGLSNLDPRDLGGFYKKNALKNFLETEASTNTENFSHFHVSVEKPAATFTTPAMIKGEN